MRSRKQCFPGDDIDAAQDALSALFPSYEQQYRTLMSKNLGSRRR